MLIDYKEQYQKYTKPWRKRNKTHTQQIDKGQRKRKEKRMGTKAFRQQLVNNKYLWMKNYPKKYMISRARYSAKKRGFECTITENDIIIPSHCPLLGIPIITHDGVTKGRNIKPDGTASLDRIDSSKGYIPGNVIVVSWRANNLKSDATLAEMQMMVSNLQKIIEGKR